MVEVVRLIAGLFPLNRLLPVVAVVVPDVGFVLAVCAGGFCAVVVFAGTFVAVVLFPLKIPPVPPPPNTPPVVDGLFAGGFVVVLAVGLLPNKFVLACSVGFPY